MFSKAGSKIYYWHIFMMLLVAMYAVLCYIEWRQYAYINSPKLPKALEGLVDSAVYETARQVELKDFKLTFWESFTHATFLLVIYGMGGLGWLWSCFGGLCDRLCKSHTSARKILSPENGFARSLLFLVVFGAIQFFVMLPFIELPRAILRTPRAVLGPWEWKKEQYKEITKSAATYLLLTVGIFLGRKRSLAFNFGWLVAAGGVVTLVSVVRFCLTPWMYFTPAPESFLSAIREVLVRTGFPAERVFLAQGIMNMMSGGLRPFGYLLLCVTFMEKILTNNVGMIKAAICHEIGHWHYFHTWIGLAVLVFEMIAGGLFLLFLARNRSVYRSFGFPVRDDQTPPFAIGVLIFLAFANVLKFFWYPVTNSISWAKEYAADGFAVKHGYGEAIFQVLQAIHQGNRIGDPLYGIFKDTHPVFASRALAVAKRMYG